MSIIDLLHQALCEEDKIKENEQYWKLISDLNELTKDMKGEQLELVNKIAALESGVCAESNDEHFRQGFIHGFKLALEIL